MSGDWKDLAQFKRHATATVLGSGQTVNELTGMQWTRLLERTDLWALNNWVYHPSVVPDFYVIETKWYGLELLKRRIAEKRSSYRDVKFVFQRDKKIKMRDGSLRAIRDVAFPGADVYEYDVVQRDPKRTSLVTDADYKFHPTALTKSYQASLTAVLEMVVRLGYSNVVFVGVDLKNSYYFWSDGDPRWGEVHHLTNKAHEGKDPREPHGTALVMDFVIDVSDRLLKRDGWGRVTSSNSALWPRVPIVNWNKL